MYITNLRANPDYHYYFNQPSVSPEGDTVEQIKAHNKAIARSKSKAEIVWKRSGHYGIIETIINGKIDQSSISNAINMDYEDVIKILSIRNAEIV